MLNLGRSIPNDERWEVCWPPLKAKGYTLVRGGQPKHWQAQLGDKIFSVTRCSNCKALVLNITEDRRNIADFEFIKEKNMLLLPTFEANTVAAYRVLDESAAKN